MFGLLPKIESKCRRHRKSSNEINEHRKPNIKHRNLRTSNNKNRTSKKMKELIKVLIVDDEPSILMSLEFLMKKEGYQVFIARDGSEAMDIIEKEVPSIVLLDIMMPNVDGYEVCYSVKNSLRFEHIKVIFLSAKNKELDMEKGYAVGADLYVTKPFSTRALVAKVNALAINVVSGSTKMD
jgi:DNA-binding response OmpR family regulator